MKLISITVILLSISLIIACSDLGSLEVDIKGDQFAVLNNTKNPVYYFAVDSEFAAYANWILRSSEENEIKPYKVKTFSITSDVGGYTDGNEIIFYYWYETQPESENVKVIIIDPESKKTERIF